MNFTWFVSNLEFVYNEDLYHIFPLYEEHWNVTLSTTESCSQPQIVKWTSTDIWEQITIMIITFIDHLPCSRHLLIFWVFFFFTCWFLKVLILFNLHTILWDIYYYYSYLCIRNWSPKSNSKWVAELGFELRHFDSRTSTFNHYVAGGRWASRPRVKWFEIHSLWTKTPRWEQQDN